MPLVSGQWVVEGVAEKMTEIAMEVKTVPRSHEGTLLIARDKLAHAIFMQAVAGRPSPRLIFIARSRGTTTRQ